MLTQDTEFYYWPKGLKQPLNSFFTTVEFTCKCTNQTCGNQRIAIDLVSRLTSIRYDLGSAILVRSGFRCAAHQEELRNQGYETAKGISQHELGRAADIAANQMGELLQLSKGQFKAVGAAKSFIHVDLRDDAVRYWSYQTL